MGKNRDRESLIRLLVNTIVHEIVMNNTNRPESAHFLNSEIIEYRSQTEKAAEKYNWNNEDKQLLEEKSLKGIKEKLAAKYPDVKYSKEEIIKKLKHLIKDIL